MDEGRRDIANRKQRRAAAKQNARHSDRLTLSARNRDAVRSLDELLATAGEHHQAGQLSVAESFYRQALAIDPKHAIAMHSLGIVAQQTGRLQMAVDLFAEAIALNGQEPRFHNNLGVVLKQQGRLDEAAASYRTALSLWPGYAEAHSNLGNVLQDQSNLVEAVASYQRALVLKPDYAEAHNNLGLALKLQGKLGEAVGCYERALALKPTYVQAYSNLGVVFHEQGKLEDAAMLYRKALALEPGYIEAHNNLGVALRAQGKLGEAIAVYGKALDLDPGYAEAHNNLGVALRDQGKPGEAIDSYERALALKPNYVEALSNLGNSFQEQGKLHDAVTCYREALTLKPDYELGQSNLLFALNCGCSIVPSDSFEEALRFGRMVQRKVGTRFASYLPSSLPEILRVGLVSGDLRAHPVAYFLASVLDSIDSSRLEIVAYPTQPRADDVTSRLRARCAKWQPLFEYSDESAARLIHSDGVHVLIDLAGHTAGNRLPLFASKPAPLQVSWLGYFATTGVAEMDYLLADPYVVPSDEQEPFTEDVWWLPETYRCFTPPDVTLDVGPLPSLSSGVVTFGCFNNLAKMNDDVVSLWARILHAIPVSRLFLKAKQLNEPATVQATRERFLERGILPNQLILEGHSPRAEMFAAYRRVDIVLDPFPYPGGTTSMEALWMGVPVVTRRGFSMLSRGGESIAHNVGLPDWIAENGEAYVAKAVSEATNLEKLAALRAALRERVLASAMCDAPRFARNFEAAMWGMWNQHA